MTILFLALGLWGIFVIFTPIGIWNAKGRISRLEKEIWELRALLKTKDDVQPNFVKPEIPKPQEPIVVAEKIEAKPEPIVNKPSEKPAIYKTNYSRANSNNEFALPDWLSSALTGGKLFVTLGILLLFIGIAMLFKYAAHYLTFPIEVRFAGVAACAIAMIAFGRSQMGKRRDYGLYLQGGGLGMLFLTVYTAFKFYALLPSDIAFALLVAIGGATFALSVIANSMGLSVLAVTGGFAAPILVATGNGNHIILFSYYMLINLVIFAIAWKKSWPLLNTIGFLFTFTLGTLWGATSYRPEYYQTTQLFLIAYFLLYVAIGIMYASRKNPEFSNPIDSASIFGVPLIGYGLQLSLVQNMINGKTISTLILGIFYVVLFIALRARRNSGLKFLSQIFMSFSILFFTLVIPFHYGSHTTAMLWSMEGACLLWLASRTGDRLNRYAGVAVLALSNLFMLGSLNLQGQGEIFLNTFFISCSVMSITHIASSYFLSRQNFDDVTDKENITVLCSVAGMLWWFLPGFNEINSHLGNNFLRTQQLIFYAVSAFVFYQLWLFARIALTVVPVRLILPAIGLVAGAGLLKASLHEYHPLMGYGYIAFPLAFFAHYYWLWHDRGANNNRLHGISLLALVALLALEAGYQLYRIDFVNSYMVCGWLLVIIGGILLLSLPSQKQFWPVDIVNKYCRIETGTPLIYAAFILCLYSFTLSSASPHEKYIPLFNLIDLVELATVIALFAFYRASSATEKAANNIVYMLAALSFAFINCVMLRIISMQTGFAYFSHEMFASMLTQTSLTILWTLASMVAMLASSRYKFRRGWLIGAGLLGVVVIKLFVRDLDGSGTLERIISFIGVGLLSLVLGYISPMPPKKGA